ncbi:MAG: SH3 domain-containing protein [Chthoniobacterales bacterium]
MIGFAVLWLAAPAHAIDDSAKLFEEGNRLYAAKDYDGALKVYEGITDGGTRNSAIFLNMGHAEYQLGRPALALINYQRALALDAGNDAARQSLEHVQKELGQSSKGLGFAQIAGRYMPFDLLVLLGSLFFWIGLLVVVYAFFSARRRTGLALLGASLAIIGATASAVAWMGDSRIALSQVSVVTKDAAAYASPSDNSQKQANLQVGEAVRVLGSNQDGWCFAKLPNDVKGWVRSEALQSVLPEEK